MKKKVVFFVFLLSFYLLCFSQKRESPNLLSQSNERNYTIAWNSPIIQSNPGYDPIKMFSFDGVHYDAEKNMLPYILLEDEKWLPNVELRLIVLSSEVISVPTEVEQIKEMADFLKNDFELTHQQYFIGKKSKTVLKITPFRKLTSGQFEKLVSYRLEIQNEGTQKKIINPIASGFSSHSVLASGTWFKIGVNQSGIFKLDKNFLESLGLDMTVINPQNIRLFGNGGKMLPESNSVPRPDDLVENAIFVEGESDGVFDDTDYVLFYGQSPHQWLQQNTSSCMKFRHRQNIYSDYSYYFLTIDSGPGKRITDRASSLLPVSHQVNTFDDFQFHENNSVNLIKSGREWYGEFFDIISSYSFNFSFPNLVIGDTVSVETAIGNRMGTTDPNAYSVYYPGGSTFITSSPVSLVNYTAPYAANGVSCVQFPGTSSNIQITINKNNASAIGWLNYIRVNARRQLTYLPGLQLSFRDTRSVGPGNVSRFQINASGSLMVWDVTDIFNVMSQSYSVSGSNLEFVYPTDTLREFVAFTPSTALDPTSFGEVPNQDLHGSPQVDYVIVYHPDFFEQAYRLAELHKVQDSLSYIMVTPQQCFNEFSSGKQDIVAIRDYVRMLYSRASGPAEAPKYLLFFGDGSYRYKSTSANTNFIPTYQSVESLQPTTSYASDDFFGLLDDSEGDFTNDAMDIAVGRIPVRNTTEANAVVSKIENYLRVNGVVNPELNSCSNLQSNGSMGEWRNGICFVADDEDFGLHVTQADSLARMVSRSHPSYNINKIYFDAYKEISTPGGQSYPDANLEFGKQVEKGCLILNYTGHGGELGLAHEGLVGIPEIQRYSNQANLPLWFTATCEFSRYDDPDRTSAGEYVLLNPSGGGIALFSTVRLVFAQNNFILSLAMWDHMLDSIDGDVPSIGKIFLKGKQNSQVFADQNMRNFTLIGDPALKLVFPRKVVITDSINGNDVNVSVDTLKALSKISVKGHLSDAAGNKLNSFNGIIYPLVYDKFSTISTLSNDGLPYSPFINFKLQKNVIYKGKATVKNGDFSFSFIVPKDIAYNYGFGKISYYAHDGFTDAAGYFSRAMVGGSDPNAVNDVTSPEVKLFMNDKKFVSGGITNENPSIYAELFDSSGINTVGNGIGHDIIAILDENSDSPIILNDYYQSDLDNYQTGKILYGLQGLTEGNHTLSLKAWDVQNNSGTAFTDFVVAKSADLALSHVLNYPNPFTTKTSFYLEHNNCCSDTDVSIDIITVSGKVVKNIRKTLSAQGYRSEPIDWDGRDDFGDKLAKGVYIYRVKIIDRDGKSAEQYEKLVILN